MTDQTLNIDQDCRQRIDRHLDAVDQVLQRAGIGRGERRQITDDLQNQVLEMLPARAGKSPKLADIEALLAELDAPEAYGSGNVAASRPATVAECLPGRGKRFLGWLALSLLGFAAILLALAMSLSSSNVLDRETVARVAFAGAFIATVLGIASFRSLPGKAAALGGGAVFLIMVVMLLWSSGPTQPSRPAKAERGVDPVPREIGKED